MGLDTFSVDVSSHDEQMKQISNLIIEDADRQQAILDALKANTLSKDEFLAELKNRNCEFKNKLFDISL